MADGIKIGNLDISAFKVGSSDCKVYLGDVKLYPQTPSHEYVEIGGVKWATMNVGATGVTDTGLYFQWGDTQGYTAAQCGSGEGQKYFGWEDYKYWTGDTGSGSSGMTKYNSTDGKRVLDASDDAVIANWGGQWRMPTAEEFQALIDATTNAWTSITVDNVTVSGIMFTDKTDSSKTLFFPACGYCSNGSVRRVGSYGHYWLSSFSTANDNYGKDLFFISMYCFISDENRYLGHPVRGVLG